ncbi:4329_t:CDS:2, partial [Entrophospora sp. SA101]
KLLKNRLDVLNNQSKEANSQSNNSKSEEKSEEAIKTTLELKEKIEKLSEKLKTSEEINKVLLENIDKSIKGEIANQQKLFQEKNKELSEKLNKDVELHLNSNQQLIKTHLENLNKGISQPLEKLNSVLLHSGKRGRWGNTNLDQLLSIYLPKEDKIYQTEFQLKKKRANDKGLRVDAIVFSVNGKHNIAIDSKFPLENYLSSVDSNLTEQQKEEFEKKFENDVKEHIEKVAEYISEEDGIKYAVMFVPSEVIFSKINEQRFYRIVGVALEKRERWNKIIKTIEYNNENIRKLDISTQKLIEDGERIKNRESASLKSITDATAEAAKKLAKKQSKKDTPKRPNSDELNIYQKLRSVQANANHLFKDKNHGHFTEYQVLGLLKPLLEEAKLTLSLSDDASQDFFYERLENGHIVRYLKIATLTNSEKKEEQLDFRF